MSKEIDRPTNVLEVTVAPDESNAAALARVATTPAVQAAATVRACGSPLGDLDINALVERLRHQVAATADNGGTEMLAAQAQTLDALFHRLTMKAMEEPNHLERMLRLALRAQSQCARTCEALAAIRRPPAVSGDFRQANVAFGPQQVNQGASESENRENELEERSHGERVDTRAASTGRKDDPAMEAVGEIHGPEDS